MTYSVVLYYKYIELCSSLEELDSIVEEHRKLCQSLELKGRVRLAMEGINGTLGGRESSIQQYISAMQQSSLFQGTDIDWKTSASDVEPFDDLQIRATKEIVALELPSDQYDLSNRGIHLSPREFKKQNEETPADNCALIDVRNTYEYNLGHFEQAMNPKTRRFGQFPEWVNNQLPELQKKDKIFMYCTGGIRCEKASAYLRHLGLPQVYQLEGGIHRYLEAYPDGGGLFKGKNFVFDHRVAVQTPDSQEVAGACEACGKPYDTLQGHRCDYCRMHVLLCENCSCQLQTTKVFCSEHKYLVQGSYEELLERKEKLGKLIQSEIGPKRKGKRRSLRKQLDTVVNRLQELDGTTDVVAA